MLNNRVRMSTKMSVFSNLSKSDKKIVFQIKDVDVSVVNSIRRLIFTDIPSVGFRFKIKDHFVESDITFIENQGPLHNEFLAHRLSLIPLHLTEEEINEWEKENYKFILYKELKSVREIEDVTTEHFRIVDKNGKDLSKSFVQRVFPKNPITNDYILITKLRPENENKKVVHLEAYATKGIGIDCACWGTVSTCTYFNTIDEEAAKVALQKLLKDVPTQKKVSVTSEFNTLQKYRHYAKNEFGEPSQFTMTVESECALSPEYIFHKAGTICISKLEDIVEKLEDEKNDTIRIETIGETPNFYLVSIQGYTHTIGNLLQALIVNKHVRQKKTLEYIGYSVPHPLENTFIMKIKFKNDTSVKVLRDFMISVMNEIISELKEMMEEFKEFAS